jgi:hypothetical protein
MVSVVRRANRFGPLASRPSDHNIMQVSDVRAAMDEPADWIRDIVGTKSWMPEFDRAQS